MSLTIFFMVCLPLGAHSFVSDVERLVLMAPLTALPPRGAVREMLDDFIAEKASKGRGAQSTEAYLAELDRLMDAQRLPQLSSSRIQVIQGTSDQVIVAPNTDAFVQSFDQQPAYHKIDADHWFPDRRLLVELILESSP